MRGYYSIINETPYELPKLALTQASQIVGEEQDSITCSPVVQDKSVTITICNGSELSKRTQTNELLAYSFKQYLRDIQATEITKLSNHFMIYMEYALRDNMTGSVVDHGVAVKDVNPKTFIFPLGITTANEYVARLGMELSASSEIRYASRHPYGINDPYRRDSYTFTIQRIWITSIKEEAWSVKPVRKPRPPYGKNPNYDYEAPHVVYGVEADRAWGLPYGMRANVPDPTIGIRPLHPSVGAVSYLPKDVSVSPSDVVLVYDTASIYEDDAVYSATINFAPTTANIAFKLKSLLPILISSEEVDDILAENKESFGSVDKPATTPSDDSNSEVIPGDDNDVTTPSTDETDNGSTSDTDKTETPSDSDKNDTDLKGDDKDVTDTSSSATGDNTENKADAGTTEPSTGSEDNNKEPEQSSGEEVKDNGDNGEQVDGTGSEGSEEVTNPTTGDGEDSQEKTEESGTPDSEATSSETDVTE